MTTAGEISFHANFLKLGDYC